MINENVNFENWVEEKYKEYSLYVCQKRALPHLIDGLKPSQRKIIYTAMRRANSFIKVISLSGYCLAEASYHHGDASLSEAISLMGKDFTGANNYPLFNGDGGFGNIFGDSHSAPRYIYVRKSKFLEKLFLKEDENILLNSDDIEDPEPKYYLPVIPYILLNGISGIAVGFSVDIPPYHPEEIIKVIKFILKNGRTPKDVVLKPFYRGYVGDIKTINNEWYMYGKVNVVNTTTLEITEVPVGTTSEAYKKHLNNLIEKGDIKDYDELSDSQWKFVIRAPRVFCKQEEEKLYEALKLKVKIHERINVIYDKIVKEYSSPIGLIEDFVNVRVDFYEKRKEYELKQFLFNIVRNFIKMIVNKHVLKSKDKFNRKDVMDFLTKKENMIHKYVKAELDGKNTLTQEDLDEIKNKVVDNLKLSDIYNDKLELYQTNIANITNDYNVLFKKDKNELYFNDIIEIEKYFNKEA